MTRVGTILKGLGSAMLLVLLIVGVPIVLFRVGAFPSTVPDLPAMWLAATRPDTGNRAVFAVLAVLVWLAWASFTISVLREIAAAIRTHGRRPARPMRGLTWSARPAEILVAAIIAVFVTAPLMGAAATPAAAGTAAIAAPSAAATVATASHHAAAVPHAGPRTKSTSATAGNAGSSGEQDHAAEVAPGRTGGGTTSQASGPAPSASETATARSTATHTAGPTRYTVHRRDTLWSIADRQLGDPLRYREIADLNADIGADYEIHAGQTLILPAATLAGSSGTSASTTSTKPRTTTSAADSSAAPAAEAPTKAKEVHVKVQAGDTLSEIAAEHGLKQWGPVWAANKGKAEPGGKRFTNPNHIEVGWDITLPATAAKHAAPAPPAPPATSPAAPAAPVGGAVEPAAAAVPSTNPAAAVPSAAVVRHAPSDKETVDQEASTPAPATPATSATPVATPVGPATAATTPIDTRAPAAPAAAVDPGEGEQVAPLVVPLAAGGAVAAAGVLAALLCLRRQQFRYRRPGRSIATSGPGLVPVEKAAVTVGAPAAGDIARLHEVLRHVAATDIEVLDLAAVQLTGSTITMHLARAASLRQPWQPVDETGMAWRFPASAAVDEAGSDPEEIGVIGPFPALVHVGSDATSSWLLNLEQIGGLVLMGDHQRCLNLARVVAAQLGLNPWADCIGVTLLGFGAELLDAAPERLRYATATEAAAVVSATRRKAERTVSTMDFGLDVVQARRQASFDEVWPPHVLLVAGDVLTARISNTSSDSANGSAGTELTSAVSDLLQLVHAHAGLTGAAVVVVGGPALTTNGADATLHLHSDGTLTLPWFDVTLTAAGWDEDTARGVGMLLAHARNAPDEKIPDATGDKPWQALSDATGALRTELVMPRATPYVHDVNTGAACSLPLADEVYLEASASTKEDLAALAPIVPADVRAQVEEADPTLDADVAAWFDDTNPTPKLSVLGPVTLRTTKPDKGRRPYFAELAAYLAHREHGASTDQIATAFSLAPGSARKYISTLRDLLGTNPGTGLPYLPNANESKSAKARGTNIYQLNDVLVDADLFRRLRLRGDARGQERGGIDDYVTALRLVTGEPFSQMRDQGGAWIVDGDRIDHHATTAIVDVAHIVNMIALAAGDTASARAAADIARLAVPADEVHRLDLAATAAAEGRTDDLRRTISQDVCNRSDDGYPPMDLSPRTKQILAHHRDWLSRAS